MSELHNAPFCNLRTQKDIQVWQENYLQCPYVHGDEHDRFYQQARRAAVRIQAGAFGLPLG